MTRASISAADIKKNPARSHLIAMEVSSLPATVHVLLSPTPCTFKYISNGTQLTVPSWSLLDQPMQHVSMRSSTYASAQHTCTLTTCTFVSSMIPLGIRNMSYSHTKSIVYCDYAGITGRKLTAIGPALPASSEVE